ncbi:hypothetical protein [Paraburkholderia sp. SIMBA_030]|uniref:hypothetical protein n=1 Tax=Paraburkholderia sp. SIMBA_030 TaxID=3085773 RepID=UPI003978708C
MSAARLDILIEQGVDLPITFAYTEDDGSAPDLTTYTAKLQVRSDYGATAAAITLDNTSGITLQQLGVGVANIAAALSSALVIDYTQVKYIVNGLRSAKLGVWDLEIKSPAGKVIRLLAGDAYLSPSATTGI